MADRRTGAAFFLLLFMLHHSGTVFPVPLQIQIDLHRL